MTEVDAGPFATLLHAYGPAVDTPGHLEALADGDEAARTAAVQHLWSAIIHQGTPWTATPAAALTVAALIGDHRLAGPDDAELRATLLRFLAAVAQAGRAWGDLDELVPPDSGIKAALEEALLAGDEDEIYEDETLGNALYARAIQGCRDITPALLETATSALSDPDPVVRGAAAYAAGACCGALGDPAQTSLVAQRLDALADDATPDQRATVVLALGELGAAPRAYLVDPHPGVRACAALAPALANDRAATAELLAALADPAAADAWFAQRPPQLDGHVRFALVAAVVQRVTDPDVLLPVALAIAPVASKHTVDRDWGPLLRALFATRSPDGLSSAQREYLGALVDNEELWDPRNGNVGLALRAVGLPHDRDACRALVDDAAA